MGSINADSTMNFPEDLRYTKEHEWVRLDGDVATIGITDYAQKELGDIVYVEVETEGDTLEENEVFGSVEAVKTVSDLFMPVAGEVVEVNEDLESDPELVNSNPYENGWMIKVKVTDVAQVEGLMTAQQYAELVGA